MQFIGGNIRDAAWRKCVTRISILEVKRPFTDQHQLLMPMPMRWVRHLPWHQRRLVHLQVLAGWYHACEDRAAHPTRTRVRGQQVKGKRAAVAKIILSGKRGRLC